MTIDFIEYCLNSDDFLPWNKIDWKYLSYNRHITIDLIERYEDKSLDWCGLSENKFGMN